MLNNSFFVFTIGKTGKKGNDGAQGPPGQTGEKGDKGHGVSGVNYVRWGRTECPGNATLVYSGKKNYLTFCIEILLITINCNWNLCASE